MLDTSARGIPLVVFNPLSEPREELVEADVEFAGAAPVAMEIVDRTTARSWPVQVLGLTSSHAHILFPAGVPAVGYKVFTLVASPTPVAAAPSATAHALANDRVRVTIDDNGDISSIRYAAGDREVLRAPIRLEMRDDPSPDKPAWRILYNTINAPVREYPANPQIKVLASGPYRSTVEITRQAAGSTIVQRVSLDLGDDRVNVETLADWKSPNTLLKASFPFVASNAKATYDLGLGTIQRGNNTEKAYEVPAQQWADITAADGSSGAAVLNDSKYGWDKPADSILRLTLLHTPLPRAYPYQSSNDLGHHRFVYAIVGHRGDWRDGQVPSLAARLNQPLVAFQTTNHPGVGTALSLAFLNGTPGQVAIKALKKAEDSDEIVVRLQEQFGRPGRTTLTMAGAIASAREINAAEEAVGPLTTTGGGVVLDFTPYQPRTIAVRMAPPAGVPAIAPVTSAPITLPFNLDGISTDKNPADGDFDGNKHTLSGDLLPHDLTVDGVRFQFGSSAPGARNVLVPNGQTLTLPAAPTGSGGAYNRVYLVAAAVGGDVPATVSVGGAPRSFTVREWEGAVGQWDSRLKEPGALREEFVPAAANGTPSTAEVRAGMLIPWDPQAFTINPADIALIRPGFVVRDEIAWIGTHRHSATGNQTYIQSYLFLYAIDVPPGVRSITLPNESRLRILAATATIAAPGVRPTMALYSKDLKDR
jgi:alpha-mannosidase